MWLGIDFGTSNSSAALMLEGNLKLIRDPIKPGYSFPSSVYVSDGGEVLVGYAADARRDQEFKRYRKEFKSDIGEVIPYSIGNQKFLPEELVTEILKKIKTEADQLVVNNGYQTLDSVVLTVPATYQTKKKGLMKKAASKAGFKDIVLLEEPVAAALYYTHSYRVEEVENILVYDLGGGTFDVALIRGKKGEFERIAPPIGLCDLGGISFDRKIYHHISAKIQDKLVKERLQKDLEERELLHDFCQDLKHQLSHSEEAISRLILDRQNYSLSRGTFNLLIDPLVQETINLCKKILTQANRKSQKVKVEKILLVGGSSRIPYIKDRLEAQLGCAVLRVDDPELAVCQGAAIYGENVMKVAPSSSNLKRKNIPLYNPNVRLWGDKK